MPIHNRFIRDHNGNPDPNGLMVLGAFIDIEIHVPLAISKALTDRGSLIPAPVTGVAIIDTGATLTCVHEPILRDQLGLQPTDVINAGTAKGPVRQNVYPVRLIALGGTPFTLDLNAVAGVDLTGQVVRTHPAYKDVIALLGRNFLRLCVFTWNGTGRFWTLSM